MSKHDNLEQFNLSTKSIEKNNSKKPQSVLAVGLLAFTLFTSGCGDTEAEAIKQVENTPPTNESSETIKTDEVATMEVPNSALINNPEMDEQTSQDTIGTEKEIITIKSLGTKAEMSVATEFSNGELVDYSQAPLNLVESYNFKYLTPEQQTELKKYDAMDLSEFRELPEEEQIKFAQWIYKNNEFRFNKILEEYGIENEYNGTIINHTDVMEYFERINIYLQAGFYTQDPENKKSGLKYKLDIAKKSLPLYRAWNFDHYGYDDYDWMVEFYSKQTQFNVYDYEINILESKNAKVNSQEGMIANVDILGSALLKSSEPKKQASIQLTPIKSIDGKETSIVQLADWCSMEYAVEINE